MASMQAVEEAPPARRRKRRPPPGCLSLMEILQLRNEHLEQLALLELEQQGRRRAHVAAKRAPRALNEA